MNKLFRFLSLAVFLMLTVTMTGKDVITIVVGGSGQTKTEAISNALMNAVRQTNQTLVVSQTDMTDDKIVRDLSSSYIKGKVLNYTEIGTAPGENNEINVMLRVDIQPDKLKSVVSSKVGTAALAGSEFVMKKRTADLKKSNELEMTKKLIDDMYELWNVLYDYEVKAGAPSYTSNDSITISYIVDAKDNNNMKAYQKLLKEALKLFNMNKEEREDYQKFYGHAPYYWKEEKVYMRNEDAIELLKFYVPLLKETSCNCYFIYDNIGDSWKAKQSGKFPHTYRIYYSQDEFAKNPIIRTAVNPKAEMVLPKHVPLTWIPSKLKAQWEKRRVAIVDRLKNFCENEETKRNLFKEIIDKKLMGIKKDPSSNDEAVDIMFDAQLFKPKQKAYRSREDEATYVQFQPKTIVTITQDTFNEVGTLAEIFSPSKIWANRFSCNEGPHKGTEYTFVARMGDGKDYNIKGRYFCKHIDNTTHIDNTKHINNEPSYIHKVTIYYDLESLKEQFGGWEALYEHLSKYGIVSLEDSYDESYPVTILTKALIAACYYEYNSILHPDQRRQMLGLPEPTPQVVDSQKPKQNNRNRRRKR